MCIAGECMKKLLKNTGFLFISKLISAIFTLSYTIYLARYLGPSDYGVIAYVLAFVGLITVVTDMGLYPLTIREIAKNKDLTEKFLGNTLSIKLLLCLITIIVIFAYVYTTTNFTEEYMCWKLIYVTVMVTIYLLLKSYNDLFYAIYQGFEKITYVGIGYILINSIIFLWIIAGSFMSFDVTGMAWGFAIAGIISFLYNLAILSKKFFKPRLYFDIQTWDYIFREAVYFGFLIIFASISYKIDSIMIGYMGGEYLVGLYNAPYKVIEGLNYLIPTVIFAISYPIMSKHFSNLDNLKNVYVAVFKSSLFLGLFISILVTIFAKYIILLLYGTDYVGSILVLKILIWSFFIICLNYPTHGILNAMGKQKLVARISFIGTLINVFLNALLIPKYGIYGASITTVITGFIIFLLSYYFIIKIFKLRKCEIINAIIPSKEDIKLFKKLK
jgi:O-antigen/teichoic acid export membrane protein